MATVSILQPPQDISGMASRRAPLANVPNAVNSPFRSVNGKRTRAQAGGELADAVPGEPPAKRHMIGHDVENQDPRKNRLVTLSALEKLDEPFAKRASNTPPTAFEKKLAAAREKKPVLQARSDKPQRTQADNIESIRQWQRHYRRQFPSFVFYFESVPDDVRAKSLRQIHSLGARVEKFFSNNVTHVVTTRPVPADPVSTSPDEDVRFENLTPKENAASALSQDQRRTTSILDAHLQRRAQSTAASAQPSLNSRRPQPQHADILSRARAMGIKIWPLEKLHRVLSTILDTDTGDNAKAHEFTGNAPATRQTAKPSQNADLEQLLKNEKVTGPTDRDMTVATQDMVTLRGVYMYVHDMDENTKPVMARDYTKPASKEQGKWPQFRLSGIGRCPFLEDLAHAKKMQQAEREAKAQQESVQRKTRAGAALQAAAPLNERSANLRRSPRKHTQACYPLDPPRPPPTRQSSEIAPAYVGGNQTSIRGLPRMVGGEPVASGMQQSNVTSAIRSQVMSSTVISSTAPAFSRRFPDSKEVHMLNRKVFEKVPTTLSNANVPSSYMNDVRAAINDDRAPPPRAAKRKAQETLGVVHEDDEASNRPRAKSAPCKKMQKIVEKEAKPGYCENCRDKFDDFDHHIASRKHRKFALTQENWDDLDDLLSKLKRPHKTG